MAHHPLKLLLRRDHIRWSGGPAPPTTDPPPTRCCCPAWTCAPASITWASIAAPGTPAPAAARASFHLILHGDCRVDLGTESLALAAGDGIFFLRDLPHADARRRPPAARPGACSRWNRASPMAPAWPAASSNSVPGWTACWPTPCPIICYCAPATRYAAARGVFQLILDETADPAASPLVLERLTDLLIFFMLRHLAARDPQAHGLLVLARDPAMAGLLQPSWPSRRCPGACRTWPTGCTCPRPPSTAVSRCTAAHARPAAAGTAHARRPQAAGTRRGHPGSRRARGLPVAAAFSRAFQRAEGMAPSACRSARPAPSKRTGRPFPPQDRPSSRAERSGCVMCASCGAARSTQFQPGCDLTSLREASSTPAGWVQWM